MTSPTTPPGSLVNIFKELEADVPGFTRPSHGCLSAWADQGEWTGTGTFFLICDVAARRR